MNCVGEGVDNEWLLSAHCGGWHLNTLGLRNANTGKGTDDELRCKRVNGPDDVRLMARKTAVVELIHRGLCTHPSIPAHPMHYRRRRSAAW
jgi:hypothetical protein